MNGRDHDRLLQAGNHAFFGRPRCRDAQRMAIQTRFAKKLTRSENCHDRFLALLGNDGKLDLSLLDVKNGVGDLPLRKNNLILPVFGYGFSLAHLGEKPFGIERELSFAFHRGRPSRTWIVRQTHDRHTTVPFLPLASSIWARRTRPPTPEPCVPDRSRGSALRTTTAA